MATTSSSINEQRCPGFSVRAWIREGKGVLFPPYQAEQITALKSLIANWMRPGHRGAAELVLDPVRALRAGDALHLACDKTAGAKHMATLDVLGRNAQRLKIKPVVLRGAPKQQDVV